MTQVRKWRQLNEKFFEMSELSFKKQMKEQELRRQLEGKDQPEKQDKKHRKAKSALHADEECGQAIKTYELKKWKRANAYIQKVQVLLLKIFADLTRYLLELYRNSYREKDLKKAILSTFEEAQVASCDFSPCHPISLRLAMSVSKFYYEDMSSIEFAIKYTMQAIMNAKEEMPVYANQLDISQKEVEGTLEALEVLEKNLKLYTTQLERRMPRTKTRI